MVQLNQGEVRRYAGVASIVIGLVCYALSSSFNRLYGEWNSFKIVAYIVSSSIICLAILFPKAWQDWRIFNHSAHMTFLVRAHMTFLVMSSTAVYSVHLDVKMNTKPDAYGLISSAAFAMTSLCMSQLVECLFLDLLYFFCTVLIGQLMRIRPLLGFVGIGFAYFAVILRYNLDARPQGGARTVEQAPIAPVYPFAALRSASVNLLNIFRRVLITLFMQITPLRPVVAPVLPSSALDARSQEEEGSNQNQASGVARSSDIVDRLYFFCVLITRLTQINLLLGYVGTGFSYFVDTLRSYLDVPVELECSDQDQAPSYLGAPAPRPPEEEGSNQDQAPVTNENCQFIGHGNGGVINGGFYMDDTGEGSNQNQAPVTSENFQSTGHGNGGVRHRSRTSRPKSSKKDQD